MADDTFQSGTLERADKFLQLYEQSCRKPRIATWAKVVVGLVGIASALFVIYQGRVAYDRYHSEKLFAAYYISIGNEFLGKKQYRRALDAFQEAEKLRPQDPEVYRGRVKAFAFLQIAQKQDLALAEVQCKLLIRVNSSDAEAYKFLGIIYANEGNYSDAQKAFTKAIELRGERYDEAEYDLARLYAEQAKTFGKLSQYESNQRVGNLQKAIETNQRLLNRNQKDTMALYNMACDYALLAETDKAIQEVEAAFANGYDHYDVIATDSDLDGIRQDDRFLQLMRTRYTEAVVKYQTLLESGKASPENLHALAWIQLFSEDPAKIQEGIDHCSRALSADPQNPAYLATLAELYAAAGKYAMALERIKQAAEKDPSRVYYMKLQTMWKQKARAH